MLYNYGLIIAYAHFILPEKWLANELPVYTTVTWVNVFFTSLRNTASITLPEKPT